MSLQTKDTIKRLLAISVEPPGMQEQDEWFQPNVDSYETEVEDEEPESHPSFSNESWIYILQTTFTK